MLEFKQEFTRHENGKHFAKDLIWNPGGREWVNLPQWDYLPMWDLFKARTGYNYHTIIGNVLIESFTLTSDLDRNEISLLVVLLTACPSSVKKRHICFSLADYKVRACHVSFFTDYKVRACLVSLWLTTRWGRVLNVSFWLTTKWGRVLSLFGWLQSEGMSCLSLAD